MNHGSYFMHMFPIPSLLCIMA